MIKQFTQSELELVYANAVNIIQSEMNFLDAITELEEAAQAGYAQAATFLAELYYQGFRVERDSLKAQYWKNLASIQA